MRLTFSMACLWTAVAWSQPGYLNPAVCSNCHSQISRTYALTGMGRSISQPEAAAARFYHEPSNRHYTLFQRDGKLIQRRHQIGFDGAETNVMEKAAEYAIGSGNHVRSYLYRTQEGKLAEMPVSWYAERGGFWAMSPGYDSPNHLDFRRTVSDECVFCHAAYPRDGMASPEAIDCQRCHGPGRAHAESGGARAIVNPKRLSRERQMDVCMQCHLETTASFPVASLRRYGRDAFSYRPGEALGDFAVYFDQAPSARRDEKFEIGYAAYGLRKSACFLKSQMTCTTCHNPHQIPRGAEAVAHFAAVCQSCHSKVAAHAAGGACIDCHMPKRRTDDVVHAVVTDHRIQRRKPERDLVAAKQESHESYRGDIVPYYPADPGELYLAVARLRYSVGSIPRLPVAVEQPEFYFELGVANSKAGKKTEAVHWYEEALRRGEYLPARKALGEALLSIGQSSRAAGVLDRVVKNFPQDTDALYALGATYLQQGKTAASRETLERVLRINTDLPLAHNLLGNFREAIRIQPDLDLAHTNLGVLLAREGDYRQAQYHLEISLANNPQSVEAHHALGLIFAGRQNAGAAEKHWRLALEYDAAYDPSHLELGRLLASRGALGEAREHLRKASESPVQALRQEALTELQKLR